MYYTCCMILSSLDLFMVFCVSCDSCDTESHDMTVTCNIILIPNSKNKRQSKSKSKSIRERK